MLKLINAIKLDMLSIFLERRNALPVFSTIFNSISKKKVYRNDEVAEGTNKIFCIYDFPSYLEPKINNSNWTIRTINSFKGSMILLTNYEDTEDYLRSNFSPGRRSKFRTYQKRLETCFNIEYKQFYGTIDSNEYESLFSRFYDMIDKRFVEKNTKNYDLTRWAIYKEIAYPLINNKEAVLFVIYSNNEPISICLNLVRGDVIYGYIRAYDIDYSKFYIGFTDFIEQLKWCYKNDIQIFDLLKGNYSYKANLIDSKYYFQKLIVYNKSAIRTRIYAECFSFRIRLFYYLIGLLKKIHIDKIFHLVLKYRYRNTDTLNLRKYAVDNKQIPNSELEKLPKINLQEDHFRFLKRPVYNFLYANKKSINTVEVFRSGNNPESFVIKSEKKVQTIIYQ